MGILKYSIETSLLSQSRLVKLNPDDTNEINNYLDTVVGLDRSSEFETEPESISGNREFVISLPAPKGCGSRLLMQMILRCAAQESLSSLFGVTVQRQNGGVQTVQRVSQYRYTSKSQSAQVTHSVKTSRVFT